MKKAQTERIQNKENKDKQRADHHYCIHPSLMENKTYSMSKGKRS